MASVWKVRNSWYLRRRGGKPESLGVISEEQARAICAEIRRRERLKARGHTVIPGLLPIGEILDRWLETKADGCLVATARRYRTHAAHFKRLLPDVAIGQLRSEDVRAFRVARANESSRATADKDLAILGQVFGWAAREDPPLVDHDPTASVKPYGDEPAERGAAHIDLLREVLVLLRKPRAAGEQARHAHTRALAADVAEAAYWTGLRLGELTRLLVRDVDMDAHTIPIRSARNKGRAKAFPIPAEAWLIFARRIDGLGSDAHVFGMTTGACAYRALQTFRTRWTATPERKRFRAAFFHSLRHAYATDLVRSRETRGIAQRLTRHRQGAVLERYEHPELDDLRAAQVRLGKWRRKPRRPTSGGR